LCGSAVDPKKCGIVRVVGSTSAPPSTVVSACSFESSTTCGSDAVEPPEDAMPDDELVDELLVDEESVEVDVLSRDAAWSLFPGFAGFPCADAPVTTTASSEPARARPSASFRKTISSP
jgi:hypothetical protein